MAPGTWLFLTNRPGWSRLKERNEWAFADAASKRVGQLAPGDRAIVYLTSHGSRPSAIAAEIEVRGNPIHGSRRTLFDDLYPIRIPVKTIGAPEDPIPFAPLIHRLEFIENKRTWGLYLKGTSMKRLSPADFAVLSRELSASTNAIEQQADRL